MDSNTSQKFVQSASPSPKLATPQQNKNSSQVAANKSKISTKPQGLAPTPAQEVQIGKYHLKVINEKCIGAASCVAIAPNTYILNEENIAEIINQNGDSDDMKLLGAQSCPTAAVIVTDTETGEQVWPIE